jgi:sporulation protein YlmC with PRC-barrel domain
MIFDVAFKNDSLLKIEGFLLDPDGEGKKLKFIPWFNLRFGHDVAMCNLIDGPLDLPEDFYSRGLLSRNDLFDLRVYTNDGIEIGLLKDVIICENEGLIEGLQCSDGLITDLLKGRMVYPIIGKITITKDNILIGKECIEESIKRNEMEV